MIRITVVNSISIVNSFAVVSSLKDKGISWLVQTENWSMLVKENLSSI
jgi:hypothetical protein